MTAATVFPLIPRRRVIGLAFGGVRSVRRGIGSDVAGSREYRPGDDVAWIDWAASARLSAARDNDEFIVHELFADEAPRVVIVADRRPSMGIAAVAAAARSTSRRRCSSALEPDRRRARARHAASPATSTTPSGETLWRPPRSERSRRSGTWSTGRSTRRPTPSRAGSSISREHRRDLPTQTFVFVLSDFLVAAGRARLAAGARAPLGARAGGHPGSGLGADVPGRRRHRRFRTPTRAPAASCRST